MILKIQNDEALDSYVSRNIIVFPEYRLENNPLKIDLRRSSPSSWSTRKIKLLASAIGWEGCFGFNKIVHNHTTYFKEVFIKKATDKAYSGNFFSNDLECNLHWYASCKETGVCVECLKNDIATKGYAYWRRSHQSNVEVCAVHNLILLRSCQFCELPFSIIGKGHFFSTFWHGCRCGESILGSQPILNISEYALKKAKLYCDIYNYEYFVDEGSAYKAIKNRLSRDGLSVWPSSREIYEHYGHNVSECWSREDFIRDFEWFSKQGEYIFSVGFLINLIILLFEDFQDFVAYLDEVSEAKRNIMNTWNTYVDGGLYSLNPNYIEAN